MIVIPASFMHAAAEPVDTETQDALDAVHGSWAVVRKGKRHGLPRGHRFGGTPQDAEAKARAAWKRLDVREGWAVLVDPEGETIARQSGPFGVRTRW